MKSISISKKTVLAKLIHSNYRVLIVLERMGIKLGLKNKTIEEVALQYSINADAFLLILNLFCNKNHSPRVDGNFDYIPDILKYLRCSHKYFLNEKIPSIQQHIKELVELIGDSKTAMVELCYKKYIEEITEHIEYENETVFPYIRQLHKAFLNKSTSPLLSKSYDIEVYEAHHGDIEDVLRDLKNILIRHLPHEEGGKWRRVILQQLFELESDLFSHSRIEDEVLIPLTAQLEDRLKSVAADLS